MCDGRTSSRLDVNPMMAEIGTIQKTVLWPELLFALAVAT